jgi:uncharacterized protein YkwD
MSLRNDTWVFAATGYARLRGVLFIGLVVVAESSCSDAKSSASPEENGRAGSSGAFGSVGASGSSHSAGGGAGTAPGTAGNDGTAGGDQTIVEPEGMGFPAPAECPEPPASESTAAIEAVNRANYYRMQAGEPCLTLVPELSVAAQKHCNYTAINRGDTRCTSNPHGEKSNCPNFVSDSFSDRIKLAGYTATPGTEALFYAGRPALAIQGWVDTVWHRAAVLYPWFDEIGYGGTTAPERCDDVELGSRSNQASYTQTWVYPYAGQTNVPLSFNGASEIPEPPAPPSGWPSGYVVSLYASGISVLSHTIAIDGTTAAIDHVWVGPGTPNRRDAEYHLYPYKPLQANTTYRVQIEAVSGSTPLSLDWTFATAAPCTHLTNCADGFACYTSGCEPAGTVAAGASCEHNSECVPNSVCALGAGPVPGTTCMSTCYSAADASDETRCDARCPNGSSPLSGELELCF